MTVRSFPQPPHPPGKYHCGCDACYRHRQGLVVPGCLCRPATPDPDLYRVATIAAWPIDGWYDDSSQQFMLEDLGHNGHPSPVLVVSIIDRNDARNAGHLGCCTVLCHGPIVLVTLRGWLDPIAL